MPHPLYHFGPSSTIGILFRRWIDIPVFLLVNVAIDLEVFIAAPGYLSSPPGRYAHTILISSLIGMMVGMIAFLLRGITTRVMREAGIPYKPSLTKLILSGILGAWLHVVTDGFYRSGVGLFWPLDFRNPLCRFDRTQVEFFCLLCFILVVPLSIYHLIKVKTKRSSQDSDIPTHDAFSKD